MKSTIVTTIKKYNSTLITSINTLRNKKYIPQDKLTFKFYNIPSFSNEFSKQTFQLSKIYSIKEDFHEKYNKNRLFLSLTSFLSVSTMIFTPINSIYIPLLINSILLPLIYYQYKKIIKITNMTIKNIFLLRNGEQILLETIDNSLILINILDIIHSSEDSLKKIILFNTVTSKFILHSNPLLTSIYNLELIYNSILSSRIVNTIYSYNTYNRYINYKFKKAFQLKQKKITILIDDYLIRSRLIKSITSIEDLFFIKSRLSLYVKVCTKSGLLFIRRVKNPLVISNNNTNDKVKGKGKGKNLISSYMLTQFIKDFIKNKPNKSNEGISIKEAIRLKDEKISYIDNSLINKNNIENMKRLYKITYFDDEKRLISKTGFGYYTFFTKIENKEIKREAIFNIGGGRKLEKRKVLSDVI